MSDIQDLAREAHDWISRRIPRGVIERRHQQEAHRRLWAVLTAAVDRDGGDDPDVTDGLDGLRHDLRQLADPKHWQRFCAIVRGGGGYLSEPDANGGHLLTGGLEHPTCVGGVASILNSLSLIAKAGTEAPAADTGKALTAIAQRTGVSNTARALGLLVEHPGWTDAKVAKTIGVARTTLYDWPEYVRAREALKRGGKEHRRRRS